MKFEYNEAMYIQLKHNSVMHIFKILTILAYNTFLFLFFFQIKPY